MNVLVPIDTDEVFHSIPVGIWVEKIEEEGYIVLDPYYSYMLQKVTVLTGKGDKEQADDVLKSFVEALLDKYGALP